MTVTGSTTCDACNEIVEPTFHIRYKGKDYHSSCFLAETESSTDREKNPPVKMVLQAEEVKSLLEVMENFLETSGGPRIRKHNTGDDGSFFGSLGDGVEGEAHPLHNVIQRLYPSISTRLAEAGRGFACCSHCGRTKHYDEMISGGESKKKVEKIMTLLSATIKGKPAREIVGEERARVFLFCDDACDKLFTERPMNEQLKNMKKIKELLAAKISPPTKTMKTEKAETETEEETEKTEEKELKECIECKRTHANFQCSDCEACLGQVLVSCNMRKSIRKRKH